MTPEEKRGAALLVFLLLLGGVWDALRPPAPVPATAPPPSVATTPPSLPERGEFPGRLNLNAATLSELDALPGLGPVLAGRIIARRGEIGRFQHIEELLAVQGIGPRLFERIRGRLHLPAESPAVVQSAPARPQRLADSTSGSPTRLR